MQGGPAHVKRAGTTMAAAGRHSCRIALHELERINRQTEQSGEHLREGGFVALAIRLGAHRHAHAAVGQERQPRILVSGTPCGFEEAASQGRCANDTPPHPPAARSSSSLRACLRLDKQRWEPYW